MKIYISYRAHDGWYISNRLQQQLAKHFPGCILTSGTDNNDEGFETAVKQANIVFVLIGKDWLNAQNENGERLLFVAEDRVKKEIGLAIDLQKIIIPVLIGGARHPRGIQLPNRLAGLSGLKPAVLRTHYLQQDIYNLIQYCKTLLLTNPDGAAGGRNNTGLQHKARLLKYYTISFISVLLLAMVDLPYPLVSIFLIGTVIITAEIYAWWLALSFKMDALFKLDYYQQQNGSQLLFTWLSPFVAYIFLLMSLVQHHHLAYKSENICPAAIHQEVTNNAAITLFNE